MRSTQPTADSWESKQQNIVFGVNLGCNLLTKNQKGGRNEKQTSYFYADWTVFSTAIGIHCSGIGR
jgi:hypothetical protein